MAVSFVKTLNIILFIIFPVLIFCSTLLDGAMRAWLSSSALLLMGAQHTNSQCQLVNQSSISLSWHAPDSTAINSLATVINGTGTFGFIFNSSTTPVSMSYGTYNWCNMPHVRSHEYIVPPTAFRLEYVELIHRHHKRTPYAANTFPQETYSWYCNDEALFYYGAPYPDGSSVQIDWQVYTDASNPFAPQGFNGTCQFPQITGQGLEDSRQHGKDLYGVYHDLLKFLPGQYDSNKTVYRVTNNVITSQVAGQVVEGMYPALGKAPFQVSIQPASIDSLEPTYICSSASAAYSSYGFGSQNPNWTVHLNQSVALFAKLDAVSGVNATDPSWHQWFDHYFDNLSSRLCHQKPLPCNAKNLSFCITEEDANDVFRRGEYEYSFIYRDSEYSLAASTASFGVWMAELASNIRQVIAGTSTIIYRHNIAHDGSVARLLSVLQLDVMVWPGMGSEVVFELYSNQGCYYLRVLWGGRVMRSSNPSLGLLDLIPVSTFLAYIDGLVGQMASKVPSLCSSSA